MTAERPSARILVGPRSLDDRICRLMYVRETDEVWTEVWNDSEWQRTPILVRLILNAPALPVSTLSRRGVPHEIGEWDREAICA